jgi:histone deacetylase 11
MIRLRLVYHPQYNISFFGLERLHPFDGRKYGRTYRALRDKWGHALRDVVIRPGAPVTGATLLTFHAPAYLEQLRQPTYLANALEVPPIARAPAWLTHWRVLRPMRWATAGTILAAREAMNCGLAINLGGGYHHASAARGEGFSIYNDIALAVLDLRARGLLKPDDKVAYIDLDAHQGNGVCHAFARDRGVFIFDMYNGTIYPVFDVEARRRIDCNLPLRRNTSGAEYLAVLREELPRFLDAINRDGRVKLAVYNAGTDVHEADELGGLALGTDAVLDRDAFVLDQTTSRAISTVVLTSGGYSRVSYALIAQMVDHVLGRWPAP